MGYWGLGGRLCMSYSLRILVSWQIIFIIITTIVHFVNLRNNFHLTPEFLCRNPYSSPRQRFPKSTLDEIYNPSGESYNSKATVAAPPLLPTQLGDARKFSHGLLRKTSYKNPTERPLPPTLLGECWETPIWTTTMHRKSLCPWRIQWNR